MTMRNRRGSVLMLVIIFSMIISLLGFAIIYMNGLEYLSVRQDIMAERATFAMEGGLELGRVFLYHCDACLDDEDDLDITYGSGSTISKDIAKAMKLHGKGHHEDYLLSGGPISFDNASPSATCKVWISPADDTHPPAGCYDYCITSRGTASYGFAGALDTVVDGSEVIRISSDPFIISSTGFFLDAFPSMMCRYWFKYLRDDGRAVACTAPTRVPHH